VKHHWMQMWLAAGDCARGGRSGVSAEEKIETVAVLSARHQSEHQGGFSAVSLSSRRRDGRRDARCDGKSPRAKLADAKALAALDKNVLYPSGGRRNEA